ncbi:putative multi-domain containing protein [Aduncisulcus paluster]|uniref:Multi-domain containing protein n=1 Tax=Aduncisulcus paluster TaxID=2918883 RepID=A0ABQ5K5K2_9EUKA|nr:putative multi-domain containing protein [Aduncisulcus paluster]
MSRIIFDESSFAMKITLSLLSSKPIEINNIRVLEADMGLKEHEKSFLNLIKHITLGTKIEISTTEDNVIFTPGTIEGGDLDVFECSNSRSLSYYIEYLLLLLPFARENTVIGLSGVTDADEELSLDVIKDVTIPSLKYFGIGRSSTSRGAFDLQIPRRGMPPLGKGLAVLRVPSVNQLNVVDFTDPGLIHDIRGIVCTARCQTQFGRSAAFSAKGLFQQLLSDIDIATRHYGKDKSGDSPGFSMELHATSTSQAMLSSSACACSIEGRHITHYTPESLGKKCAERLFREISEGGVVDSSHQVIMMVLMTLAPEKMSRIRIGRITPRSIRVLRLLKEFFGVSFNLQTADERWVQKCIREKKEVTKREKRSKHGEQESIICVCQGIGYKNVARQVK